MAPSRCAFMAFPLILVILALGEAHRIPLVPKSVEESANMPLSAGPEITGQTEGSDMSTGEGGNPWDGQSGVCGDGDCSTDDPPDLGVRIGHHYGGDGSVNQQWANRPLYCVPLECQGLDECSSAYVVNFGVVQATPPEEDPGFGIPDMHIMPGKEGKGYSKENGGKPEEYGAMPPESA